ncbi:MAG TPA: MFS transporter [Planctomycetota bacterium]|nr:MFS transporter [Planctomycetota bacterium]
MSSAPEVAPSTPTGARAVLALRDFRLYLLTTVALTVGVGIQATALGWQIFQLTGDKLALGLTGLAEAIPSIGIILFAGHFADRLDRRRMILWATGALFLCAVAFTALAVAAPTRGDAAADPSWTARLFSRPDETAREGPPPLERTAPVVLAIYAVIVLTGFARGVLGPARTALGTDLVPREHLTAAINLRTSFWQGGMILGPPLGGGLYALGGAPLAFAVDGLLILVAFAAARALRVRRAAAAAPRTEPLGRSLAQGVAFVRGRKEILGALTLDLFAVLFGGAVAILPAFAKDVLFVDETGLGVLRASQSVGAVLTAVLVARMPPFRRAGRTMLFAVAIFGLAMIGFAVSKVFLLSALLLAVAGAADYVSVVVRHTLVQTRTPPEMLGRVSAVNSVFIGSSNEIGAFESGVAAHYLGTVPSVVFGGSMTLLTVALVAWRAPALRRLGPLR